MYLVEIKLGNYKIRRYIYNMETLQKLMLDNPQYEYIKIIEEVNFNDKTNEITRKKKR